MTNKIMQEYLVLGGEHHGKVWRGVWTAMGLNLAQEDERYGQFYERQGPQKVQLAREEHYFISEWTSPQGERFLLACADDLAQFDIACEVARVSPPLRPLEDAVKDWV